MIETNLIEDLRHLTPPSYLWLAGGMAVLLAATIAVLLIRRRRRTDERTAAGGAESCRPWEDALAALEHLVPLLVPERSRDYGIAATGILRRYLEDRYQLHAPLLATEEFLALAAGSPVLPADHQHGLTCFLERGDLFKFGRYAGTSEELRELHTAAIEFVMASRPSVPATVKEAR